MDILKTVEGFWFLQCHLNAFVPDEKGKINPGGPTKCLFFLFHCFPWDGGTGRCGSKQSLRGDVLLRVFKALWSMT